MGMGLGEPVLKWLLLTILIGACSKGEPRGSHGIRIAHVDITRTGSGYAFAVRHCGGLKGPVSLLLLHVEEAPGDEPEGPLVCEMWFLGRGGAAALGGAAPSGATWHYGVTPPGYERRGECRPLERGKSYRFTAFIW